MGHLHLLNTVKRTLSRVRSDEGGWAIVIAMALMSVMLASGLALAMTVDIEGKQSATQRTRETAFNLAEAALNAQVRAVGYKWPGTSAGAFQPCPSATLPTQCPVDGQLQRLIPSVDTRNGITWSTEVRDNNSGQFYSDALPRVGWDQDRDGYVWVKATATAAGRSRTMVALVRVTYQQEDMIRAAVRTGSVAFGNNSPNKHYLNGGSASEVQIRCTVVVNGAPCEGISPPQGSFKTAADVDQQFRSTWVTGAQVTTADLSPAMTADTLQRMKDTAIALGTYYNASCPSSLTGQVIYLDHVTCGTYTGTAVDNSAQSPGFIIVDGGQLSIGGTHTFYGVLYWTETRTPAPVPPNPVIDFGGTSQLFGGLVTDGNTTVKIGDSNNGSTINFQGAGFQNIRSIATADVVQNTWRELTK